MTVAVLLGLFAHDAIGMPIDTIRVGRDISRTSILHISTYRRTLNFGGCESFGQLFRPAPYPGVTIFDFPYQNLGLGSGAPADGIRMIASLIPASVCSASAMLKRDISRYPATCLPGGDHLLLRIIFALNTAPRPSRRS